MKTEKKIYYTLKNQSNTRLVIDLNDNSFTIDSNENVARFFKGYFRKKEDFQSKFLDLLRGIEDTNGDVFKTKDFANELEFMYDNATPFTYTEAFKLENNEFKSIVFGTINVSEMIENLGSKRINTDGRTSMQKVYDKSGNFICNREISNIYEVYEVNGEKLGVTGNLYALKCWCTTTNNEHWLWIEEKYKDNPLEAIASTFRVHEDVIDKLKEIKRQGDILLVELKEEYKDFIPSGEMVPLTSDQYFSLLTAQA